MQLLLVNSGAILPKGATEAFQRPGWKVARVPDYEAALRAARASTIDAVIACPPVLPESQNHTADEQFHDTCDHADFRSFMRLAAAERIAVLLVGEEQAAAVDNNPLAECLPGRVSLPELIGRLTTVDKYHGLVRRLEHELHNLERIGKRLNEHFSEVDQEMRLAARLQLDFLPRIGTPIENAQFSAIYRPASWVSGDLYDVIRVDEDHIAFYIADAVGHGMAASLLTMFIKRTIVAKRIEGNNYTIVQPDQALADLNRALSEQSLPNCQFVTAWYGLLNVRTLKLRYARGGHPHPLLLGADGTTSELKASGGLLGLFPEEDFPVSETYLSPGDKLMLFTDGLELAFGEKDDMPDVLAYREFFESVHSLPIHEATATLESRILEHAAGENARDDVTILGLEILNR
jgi:serine phosphatase RsbU (regulator of sigma subunit)